MRLTADDLRATLWQRQGLLERAESSPDAVRHWTELLIGLQGQDRLPPYLGLAARLDGFAPGHLSDQLAEGALVRMVTMRGTLHVHTPADALTLRSFTRPAQEREYAASATIAPARGVPAEEIAAAARRLCASPISMKELGIRLAEQWPDVPPGALAHVARVTVSLVQVPPRGLWERSGGVVLQDVGAYLGAAESSADRPAIAARYLRAFGPATAADLTAWSGVPGLTEVIAEVPGLIEHQGPDGALFDVSDAPIVPGDTALGVRLLGKYDNLWLAHRARDRVTDPEARRRWMGANGGSGHTVFVEGRLAGLWRVSEGLVETELFGSIPAAARRALRTETDRVQALLAQP